MIDHTGIRVADVARSTAFYDAALGAVGFRRVIQPPEDDGADGVGYGFFVFWIDRSAPCKSRHMTGCQTPSPHRC